MGFFNMFEKKPQDFAEYAKTVSGAEQTELMALAKNKTNAVF